jgi:hypothetical protein
VPGRSRRHADGVSVATADILTHLRSTLLPHPDEASRLPHPRRASERADTHMAVDPPEGPPPGWVPRTTRPSRPSHEPGA